MGAIFGIGVDAVAINRMEGPRITAHMVARLFHPSEVLQSQGLEGRVRSEFLASRFAAKEAFVKALGTGFHGIVPSDIAVTVDADGKPSLVLHGAALAGFDAAHRRLHLSLTHEDPLAIAFVVIEMIGDGDGQM